MMGEDCWAPEPVVQRAPRLSTFRKAVSTLRKRLLALGGQARATVAARHESGVHSLACLHDAHAHYDEPVEGFGYRLCQVKNYLHGFFVH